MKRLITKKFVWLVVLVGFIEVLSTTPALAISLGFAPSSQTVQVGLPITVDVLISDLGAFTEPSVGTFDLDVSFDPAILLPTDVTFGRFLGDPGLFEALTDFTFSPGVVDFAEVSLLSPSQLDSLQLENFSLATLSFDTLAVGMSSLTFSQVIVDDAFGMKLDIDPGSGKVNVVPEPTTMFLLGSGLGLLGFKRKFRKS